MLVGRAGHAVHYDKRRRLKHAPLKVLTACMPCRMFPVLILAGGLITLYTKRKEDVSMSHVDEHVEHLGLNKF